ncbi:MAG: hypothetical protein AAFQ38_15015 [Pseudomonadota bacterium]
MTIARLKEQRDSLLRRIKRREPGMRDLQARLRVVVRDLMAAENAHRRGSK